MTRVSFCVAAIVSVVMAAGCAQPESSAEWHLEIDGAWADSGTSAELIDRAAAVLEARMEIFGESGPIAGTVEVVGERIIVRVSDPDAETVSLSPLFAVGDVALHRVREDVRMDTAFPELDSVLAAHEARVEIPGLGPMSVSEPERGEYMVRAADFSHVDRFILESGANRRLGPELMLAWAHSESGRPGEPSVALYVLDDEPLVTHRDVEDAYAADLATEPGVAFALTENAGGRLAREAGRYVGGRIALIFDGWVLGEPAVIGDAIGRYGKIDTPWGVTEVDLYALSVFLRSGPLPVPLAVVHGSGSP